MDVLTFGRSEQHEILCLHRQLLLVDRVLNPQNAEHVPSVCGDSKIEINITTLSVYADGCGFVWVENSD